MLNFYMNPLSPYAVKVLFLLEEAAIPHKAHVVNARDPKGRELLDKVSPFGKVPAIEVDGFHLSESGAILRYLTERHELHSLYPVHLEERAEIDMLMDFTQLHVSRWLGSLHWNLALAPKFNMPVDQHSVDEAQGFLPVSLERLDRWVTGRTYLAGQAFTLADISFLPAIYQHKAAHVSLSDFPNVASWLARVTERPAWKKTVAEIDRRMTEMMSSHR